MGSVVASQNLRKHWLRNPCNGAKLFKVVVKGIDQAETLHHHFAGTIRETQILVMILPEYVPASGDILNGDMLYPGHTLLP